MSDKVKIALTDLQREWANAFLRAMGGQGTVDVDKKQSPKPKEKKVQLLGELGKHFDIVTAREDFAGTNEDISRTFIVEKTDKKKNVEKVEKKVLSLDRGYKDKVVKPVDKLLSSVDKLLEKDAPITRETLPQINIVMNNLTVAYQHYSGKEPKNDSKEEKLKAEQREKKAKAIDERKKALQRMIEISKLKSGGKELALAKLDTPTKAKMMEDNPDIFNAVIAAKPSALELGELIAAMKDPEGFLEQIIDAHGDDKHYMELVCQQVLESELAKGISGGNTMLRGNTTATRLTKAYSMTGDGGKLIGKCAEYTGVWVDRVKNGRTVELDPSREENEGNREQSESDLAQLIRSMLRFVMSAPVPREVATIASMIAENARKLQKTEGDVAILVGGHVFLRLICPAITSIKGLTPEQTRAVILGSKLLQNASNGIIKSINEPYLNVLSDVIEEEIPGLHYWFLEIAKLGDKLRGLPKDQESLLELIEELESGDIDPAWFAQPSEDDPFGVQPAAPNTQIGQLILSALAAEPAPEGVFLPEPMNPSHLKLVDRQRKIVVAAIVKGLKKRIV